jgi:hypothetical protein
MKIIGMRALLFAIVISLAATASTNAGLVVLRSTPDNLSKPSHLEYFTLEINFDISPDENTTDAEPTLTNIWDSNKESDNDLLVHLLNNIKWDSRYYVVIRGRGGNGARTDNWPPPLSGKPRNLNLISHTAMRGPLGVLNKFTATMPYTGKASMKFGIDHGFNNYNDDVASAITANTQTLTTGTP